MTASGSPLVVFDLDHTITRWDTGTRFFVWLLRRSGAKLGVAAVTAPWLAPLLVFHRTRRVPIRFGTWLATFGHTHEQLVQLAGEHVAQVLDQGEKFIRRQARERIEFHRAQGHIVIIATGAPELLARAIFRAEDLSDIAVVGSTLRPYRGGRVADQHCYGEHKVRMLKTSGHVPPWAFVYSDHEADLPLLRAGAVQFVVNPKPKSTARMLAALGNTATVVSWVG